MGLVNELYLEDLSLATRIIVLHEGPNPTTDFYLSSRLSQLDLPIEWLNWNQLPDPALLQGAALIVVRYLTPTWQRFLNQHVMKLSQFIWLIDDDLLDFRVLLQVSGGLGWKWFWRAWRFQSLFKRHSVSLWVSTPYLAEKYASWQPLILPPCSPYSNLSAHSLDISVGSKKPIVFYHGSLSHRREQKWLYPVFEEVARQCPNVTFELIGNRSVARFFAAIPQVKVYPPMSWIDYKQWIQQPGRTLGLAPLLDDPVNAARAPTRFYDIQAAGAQGLFAEGAVYGSVIEYGVNGFLLPMVQEEWVKTIVRYLTKP